MKVTATAVAFSAVPEVAEAALLDKIAVTARRFLGGLTLSESRQIQNVVNQASRPLEVVGSAAQGTRRGVRTDLPIGRGLAPEATSTVFHHHQVKAILMVCKISFLELIRRLESYRGFRIQILILLIGLNLIIIKLMRRFWFEFIDAKKFSPLGMGCGVTARDEEDAIGILREKVPASSELKIAKIVRDVSIDDLDRDHVVPNIGNIFVRGVWFPQGY